MPIQHLLHHQIDKVAWDDCIDHASNGLVYALSWYLDTVSPGWEAFVVVHKKQYQVCFPIPIRQKWKAKYVMHPFVCQQLGFFCRELLSTTMEEQLLDALFTKYHYIPQLIFNTYNVQALRSYSHRIHSRDHPKKQRPAQLHVKTYHTHELSLDKPYEILHENYRRDRKYRLRQAQERNIRFVPSDDIEPLIDIFIQDTEPRMPRYTYSHNYEPLRNLFATVKRRGQYELYYTLDDQGNYTSGCWFVFFHYRIIYLYNAALDRVRGENGRTLLIDYIIQKYQNSSYVFDFESPEEESIYDFYASFGSEPTSYCSLYANSLPMWVRKGHRAKIIVQRRILQYRHPNLQLPDIILPV